MISATFEVKNTQGLHFINAMERIENSYNCWVDPIDSNHVYIEMPKEAQIMITDILRFYKDKE